MDIKTQAGLIWGLVKAEPVKTAKTKKFGNKTSWAALESESKSG